MAAALIPATHAFGGLTTAPDVQRLGSELGSHGSWVRQIECATQPSELHSFCGDGRTSYRPPPANESCCFRSKPCFRAVYDGAIGASSEPWSRKVVDGYVQQIVRVLNSLGVGDVTPSKVRIQQYEAPYIDGVTVPRMWLFPNDKQSAGAPSGEAIRWSRRRDKRPAQNADAEFRRWMEGLDRPSGQGSTQEDASLPVNSWAGLHADRHENAGMQFSALYYLSTGHRAPLVGGETGIADELLRDPETNSTHLKRGVLIEPVPGRLVLFSSGGENYHGAMPVLQGARSALNVFFHCKCAS